MLDRPLQPVVDFLPSGKTIGPRQQDRKLGDFSRHGFNIDRAIVLFHDDVMAHR